MALYEYKCKSCGYEFEELITTNEDNFITKCKKCGEDAERKISGFSAIVIGSSNESIDKKIGQEAEKRWEMHHNRQNQRRANKKLQVFKLPKENGKYTPVMALGDKKEKKKRDEFSVALQEHKKDRIKRGQLQFTEAGSF